MHYYHLGNFGLNHFLSSLGKRLIKLVFIDLLLSQEVKIHTRQQKSYLNAFDDPQLCFYYLKRVLVQPQDQILLIY